MKIIISIDDVCPKPDWQILGTPVEGWLRSLNEDFGAKFTCFCPSNYHGEYPISHHLGWMNELLSIPWIEIAAHGARHDTTDPKRFGEMEFAEIQTEEVARERLNWMWAEWMMVQYLPDGWKSPGWVCSEPAKNVIEGSFKYVSLHYEHNMNYPWKCQTFFGHDGIQQENIRLHNVSVRNQDGMIMFTSHIAGDWNHNVWNEANYEQLRLSLEYLTETFDCKFKTLRECLN